MTIALISDVEQRGVDRRRRCGAALSLLAS
jgi:hypothetical protein